MPYLAKKCEAAVAYEAAKGDAGVELTEEGGEGAEAVKIENIYR
jgi:hypothetical protein